MPNLVLFSRSDDDENFQFSVSASVFYFSTSICPEVLCKKGFLKIFQNPQGNTCVGLSFYNKVTGLRPATL